MGADTDLGQATPTSTSTSTTTTSTSSAATATGAATTSTQGATTTTKARHHHHPHHNHHRSSSRDGDYEIIGERHWQILENAHQGNDDLVKIYGYRRRNLNKFLYHLFCIMFAGLPYFFFSWYPKYSKVKYSKCGLRIAELIYIVDDEGACIITEVVENDINLHQFNEKKLRYFIYQHSRYIWMNDSGSFVNVQVLSEKLTVAHLMENIIGLNRKQQNELTKLYGDNGIEVKVKSYWSLFTSEVFNPFYVFQIFSITLWSLDEYYQYAICVFILSVISIVTSLYQTKKLSIALHDLVEKSNCHSVTVQRPSQQECLISARSLVPGDILVLPPSGYNMPCDALLLTGTCIVNESMLTGESVPVVKSPPNMSSEYYSTTTHKRHTLYAGTSVIQTRFYGNNKVLAKVVRTGFYTSKGELVKSILFPKPMGFQFYKDAVKFVIFLFAISAIGMGYCIWLYVQRGSTIKTILLRTLDIITIVVPPALPAAMTAGTVYSQRRLKKHDIFCISPPRINVCGKLNLICFDKTGTLTEDGLDLYAVLPHDSCNFGEPIHNISLLPIKSPLTQALASCHSLTSIDNQLTGDPLDLKMFEATGWVLEEPGPENTRYDNLAPTVVKPASTSEASLLKEDIDPLTLDIPYEIGLLRRFHFSSTQQAMGVIARVLGQNQMLYFVKGSPEKISGMCNQSSVPNNFSYVLNDYASRGFRVIGLAYKKLNRKMKWIDAQRVKREQLECDMTFLGLLVMQNSLKPESAPIIRDLHRANMRLVMITGDNIMTAISVARDCGMIPKDEKIILLSHCHQPSSPSINSESGPRPALQFEVIGEPKDSPQTKSEHPGQVSINMSSKEKYCFALDGKTWNVLRQHYPDLLMPILLKGTVFGRFGPDQKTQLVVSFQQLGYVTGMCGDGANDCGALKAAHIGISLSQAEASVAAPFTSRVQNITCVKYLALEGRCALCTSFGTFKYMALYSLIQFVSVLILYNHYSILGDMQFLFIDLVVTTSLALSMARAGPPADLCSKSPPVSLVGFGTTVPLLLQVLMCLFAQLSALYVLSLQPWYSAVEGGPDVEEVMCWENTVIFIISSYQYLILAGVYSKGQPFREAFCSNYYLVFTIILLTSFTTFLLMCPVKAIANFFEVFPWDFDDAEVNHFKLYLLLIPMLHLLFAVTVEALLSDSPIFKIVAKRLFPNKFKTENYKTYMKQLEGYQWMDSIGETTSC